jgi:hypothetical protein
LPKLLSYRTAYIQEFFAGLEPLKDLGIDGGLRDAQIKKAE